MQGGWAGAVGSGVGVVEEGSCFILRATSSLQDKVYIWQ